MEKQSKEILIRLKESKRYEFLTHPKHDIDFSSVKNFANSINRLNFLTNPQKKDLCGYLNPKIFAVLPGPPFTVWGIKNNQLFFYESKQPNQISPEQGLDASSEELVNKALLAIGKIEIHNHTTLSAPKRYPGTGFLVANNIIVTCAHVAQHFTNEDGRTFSVFNKYRLRPNIDFREEYDNNIIPELHLSITEVLYFDEKLDLALLRVEPHEMLNHPGLTLSHPPSTLGRRVVGVGYPSSMILEKNFGISQKILNLFHNPDRHLEFNFKVASLGKIIDPEKASHSQIVSTEKHFLHDCPMIKGHSGSPIIDLSTGNVIGMHCGGHQKRKYNYALRADIIMDKLPKSK